MKKYSLCGVELSDWTCKFLEVCEQLMRADEMKGIEKSKDLLKENLQKSSEYPYKRCQNGTQIRELPTYR